jgi:hypothetical protein
MSFPFAPMPNLKAFIDAAVKEGCQEGVSQAPIVTPRGATAARYLIGTTGVIYILPNIDDDECLNPTVLASMIRVLKIKAFRELCEHLL